MIFFFGEGHRCPCGLPLYRCYTEMPTQKAMSDVWFNRFSSAYEDWESTSCSRDEYDAITTNTSDPDRCLCGRSPSNGCSGARSMRRQLMYEELLGLSKAMNGMEPLWRETEEDFLHIYGRLFLEVAMHHGERWFKEMLGTLQETGKIDEAVAEKMRKLREIAWAIDATTDGAMQVERNVAKYPRDYPEGRWTALHYEMLARAGAKPDDGG